MTIVLLGVDALDAGLVERWDLPNIPEGGQIETYAHSKDIPLTQEVWPTVATGLEPVEHGITEGNMSEWSNPLLDVASKFTWFLPADIRSQMGDIASGATGDEYSISETDAATIFDGEHRLVHDWPGVVNSHWLKEAWGVAAPTENESQSPEEFLRDLKAIGAQQFAWVEEVVQHPSALAATHVHTPDMAGHVFSDDEPRLRDVYRWIDTWIGRIREQLSNEDELLVLSDHGMVVSWYQEESDPPGGLGEHSWRAFSGATSGDRPESVYDVHDWVEKRISDHIPDVEGQVDVPMETLEDLGYV